MQQKTSRKMMTESENKVKALRQFIFNQFENEDFLPLQAIFDSYDPNKLLYCSLHEINSVTESSPHKKTMQPAFAIATLVLSLVAVIKLCKK